MFIKKLRIIKYSLYYIHSKAQKIMEENVVSQYFLIFNVFVNDNIND